MDRTAGIIVIGNEILSGKVVDTNSPFLARELRGLGVTLLRILTIPDDVETIAAAVREFHTSFDVVFTSGGVGPTHDDVTMEGVARGLGRRVIRHPAIEGRLREYLKDKVNAARLKMAEVPEGSELIVDAPSARTSTSCRASRRSSSRSSQRSASASRRRPTSSASSTRARARGRSPSTCTRRSPPSRSCCSAPIRRWRTPSTP